MLQKRRAKKAVNRVNSSLRGCVTSSPDDLDVRAAVVVEGVRIAHRTAGHLAEPTPSTLTVVLMSFDHDDRVALYMAGEPSALVKHVRECISESSAEQELRRWIPSEVYDCPFDHLPGIFKTAFWSVLFGFELEQMESDFGWVLPGHDEWYLIRDFPPRLENGEAPKQVEFKQIPKTVAQHLINQGDPIARAFP